MTNHPAIPAVVAARYEANEWRISLVVRFQRIGLMEAVDAPSQSL
jgi:hypothetical protein